MEDLPSGVAPTRRTFEKRRVVLRVAVGFFLSSWVYLARWIDRARGGRVSSLWHLDGGPSPRLPSMHSSEIQYRADGAIGDVSLVVFGSEEGHFVQLRALELGWSEPEPPR